MVATEKGFTLIEVLVAIVMLSLGLLGLGRMHIAAIQVNTIASRLTQGTTLAQDRAEQLMALPYDPMLADTTGLGALPAILILILLKVIPSDGKWIPMYPLEG